ncbi:hypothetical protein BC938DRAFT_474273 [Jimgerdemannia flammicorona]|uniref:Uncharacterized protein n=1 Tax=Jimgerdemannia flammicorona TaxID=994334 RepID=A0A433QZJ0_9FUNG|nr:hypothetical protein BC938DRAFT_474273 [Jimgerdemannia flammicorona]
MTNEDVSHPSGTPADPPIQSGLGPVLRFGRRLIAIKSYESLEDEGRESELRRDLNTWVGFRARWISCGGCAATLIDLTFVGIGAIIGTGIFVLTVPQRRLLYSIQRHPGHAAAVNAGPAIVISFIISGVAAGLAALSYSEMASMIPVAG